MDKHQQNKHENEKLDHVIQQNQELINNLTRKIDRRINNGYYCEMTVKRRSLPFPKKNRQKTPASKPKKIHPPFKKVKKPIEKLEMVDNEQNTDQMQFLDGWQNTSKQYALKQADKIVEDQQMQWSCAVTEIEKNDQSMQWSIQPVAQLHRQIQYTLQSQMVQCKDASVQYSEESSESQEEVLPIVVKQVQDKCVQKQQQKIIKQDQQVQCQKTARGQISIQFDQPLPSTSQMIIQIDIPDQNQLTKISSMENRIKYMKLKQAKQQKLQKKTEKKIEILKLKEIIEKMQSKVELAELKQINLKKNLEKQIEMAEKQTKYKRQFKKNKDFIVKQYNNKMEVIFNKIKQGTNQSSRTSNNIIDYLKKEKDQELKLNQRSKQELKTYKKQVIQLKEEVKRQMFKRLNYENQCDQQDCNLQKRRNQSLYINSHLKKQSNQSSMQALFLNSSLNKNKYAGTIIKNISNSLEKTTQNKLNQHIEIANLSKAYWRQRSAFDYSYQADETMRMNRKDQYLKKIQQKLQQSKLINPESQGIVKQFKLYSPLKRNHQDNSKQLTKNTKCERYVRAKHGLNWTEMRQIGKRFDQLYENQQLFKYLYSEQSKIKLGQKLFENMNIALKLNNNSIQIYKYYKYIVYQHRKQSGIQYLLFYHFSKMVIFGKLPQLTQTDYHFYSHPHKYKNGEVFEYINQSQLFSGYYENGLRQGYGILSDNLIFYQGLFCEGKKSGKGKLILENGDIYKGQFINNQFHGEGRYQFINGESYDGYFSTGLKNGFGKYSFSNGDTYEGQYTNNKRNGKGKYKSNDGSQYEGQFVNDQKCGSGKITFENGMFIVGIWSADELVQAKSRQTPYKIHKDQDLPIQLKSKLRHN